MNRPAIRRAPRAVIFPTVEPEYRDARALEPLLVHEFCFNGETHRLTNPIDWLQNPSVDREWSILLHKFYYAPALGAQFVQSGDVRLLNAWVALTESWIGQVPLDFLPSDVTGRRIQNWLYAYHYFVDQADAAARLPIGFIARFNASLTLQVNHLYRNLHAKRNHRTLELHAIFLAGLMLPMLPGPVEWRHWALRQLIDNLLEDLLPDGVHCELATDYHHIVLRNFLAVRRLCRANELSFPPQADARLLRALEFALHAHKPDGAVPALSDGDARSHADVLALGAELFDEPALRYAATAGATGRAPSTNGAYFAQGGYAFMRSGWGTAAPYRDERYLAFDCGPLGEGNHGHFDLLNVEFAAYGRSLVVDPGRYTYHEQNTAHEPNWRVRFRSTATHNTVTVDGCQQIRYEQGPTRFKIRGPAPTCTLTAFALNGVTGYVGGRARSAEYPAVHTRHVFFVRGEYWVLVDELASPQVHDYVQHFQLSEVAQAGVTQADERGWQRFDSPQLTVWSAKPAVGEVEFSWVSYRYGIKHAAPALTFRRRAQQARFVTVLYPYAVTPPKLDLALNDQSLMDRHNNLALTVRSRGVDEEREDLITLPANARASVRTKNSTCAYESLLDVALSEESATPLVELL